MRARNLAPGSVIDYGLWASAIRFGLDWSDFDYLRSADRFCAPMLVFHGHADASIPRGPSRELAEERTDIVRLVSLENVAMSRAGMRTPELTGLRSWVS